MEIIGPVLVLIAIPMMLRWVPPNRLYGFRIAPTLRNRTVWYDINAQSGRHFFLLGLLMVALDFAVPDGIRGAALWLTCLTGLAAIIVVNVRSAYRWERKRTTSVVRRPA